MKRYLLPILLFFTFLSYSQITTDESYTTQQLVEGVLINSSSAVVSNFIQFDFVPQINEIGFDKYNFDPFNPAATAEGLGDYVFQLDDSPFQEDGLFEGVLTGLHTVTIKNANGFGSVIIEGSIIDYRRFFTSDQGRYHDTLNIIGIAGGDSTAKIYIFDRFGKLLKQLSPLGEG